MRTIIGLAALARSGKDTVASMLLEHPGVAAFALADPLKAGCQALFGLTEEETWHDDMKEQPIGLWGRSPREFFQTVGTEWMRNHNPEQWLLRAAREINPPQRLSPPCAAADPEAAVPPSSMELAHPDAPFILAAQAIFDFEHHQLANTTALNTPDPYWNICPAEAIHLLREHALALYPDFQARRARRPITALKRNGQVPASASTIIIKDIRFENEAAFLRANEGEIWHIKRPSPPTVIAHSSELGVEKAPADVTIINDGSIQDLRVRVEQAWAEHQQRRRVFDSVDDTGHLSRMTHKKDEAKKSQGAGE